jgi:hypothetical protein
MNQYKPYFDSVRMQPWLRDGKPVLDGARIGFICKKSHYCYVNLNAIRLGAVNDYQCDTCARPLSEVFTCVYRDKPLNIAIGDQLEPVPHPRILLPDTTDEGRLKEALERFNDEIATEGI